LNYICLGLVFHGPVIANEVKQYFDLQEVRDCFAAARNDFIY